MTPNELRRMFPEASEAFIQANSQVSGPEPQRPVCHEPLAKVPGEKAHPTRFLVSVKSFRITLLDEDNITEKYHVDCLRYAGVIPNDSPQICTIQVSQQQVKTKEEERTEIEVYDVYE